MMQLFSLLLKLSFLICFLLPNQADAKLFKNAYVSFELPKGWDCQLSRRVWTCRYKPDKTCRGPFLDKKKCYKEIKRTKEAIFILTAKAVGKDDTFEKYFERFKQKRPILTQKGRKSESKVIRLKRVNINKQTWIESLHLGSEIPPYYTQYLATIKGKVAILVGLSAHKLYYTKYSGAFFKTIKSLKVLTDKPIQVDRRDYKTGENATLGKTNRIELDGLDKVSHPNANEPQGGLNHVDFMLLFGAIFLALLGVFIWIRSLR